MSLYNRDKRAEEILGSKGRIRVLEVLTESGELNISEVSRRTGLNYTSVERHLMKLKNMGLLNEKRYGKIRIFEVTFRSFHVGFEKSAIFGWGQLVIVPSDHKYRGLDGTEPFHDIKIVAGPKISGSHFRAAFGTGNNSLP